MLQMKNMEQDDKNSKQHDHLEYEPSNLKIKFQHIKKFISPNYIVKLMYRPTDPSSLGIIRFLFGLLMLIDLSEERGGSELDIRWGNPKTCHFPLFDILKPPGFEYITLLYGIMWLGASGIMLGFKFRLSTLLFGIPYWYILLLDKSFWNNHSYLYGLVTILLMGSSANHYWSVDGILDSRKRNAHVPYWNYFILKFQFFALYFLAGLKKTDVEWLDGYSMRNLGTHWVFLPFTILLTTDQIDYLIVHWFGFLLDLTIGFWMLIETTRPIAMLFCSCFHLMNSRLFSIGMFPYVCLATMPLFCEETWPKKIQKMCRKAVPEPKPSEYCIYTENEASLYKDKKLKTKVGWKNYITILLLLTHCGLQGFLPYSHFITKGYNNWTKGLYGYSWDMMVHSWDTILVIVKIVDNNSGEENFLDPDAWTLNDRWNKHADMCLQYANCINNNINLDISSSGRKDLADKMQNISIYVDVWCSLNGRFQQRMYNPNYDLLNANWSPFTPVEWLLPLLSEYNDFRKTISDLTKEVNSWSNYSDVLFIADFPSLYLENFITDDLYNVTLTVLEGAVFYEIEDELSYKSYGIKLFKGDSYPIETGIFHKIHVISNSPSCYMYTFINKTIEMMGEKPRYSNNGRLSYSPFPLLEDVNYRVDNFYRMYELISQSVIHLISNNSLTVVI